MIQTATIITFDAGRSCVVLGAPPRTCGTASLVDEGFVLEVDALEPDRLVRLWADVSIPIGQAALDAWTGFDGVNQTSQSETALSVRLAGVTPRARLLGELARLELLERVDAGPRGRMWNVERRVAKLDLAELDDRFLRWIDVESLLEAIDDLLAVSELIRSEPTVVSDAVRAALAKLAQRLTKDSPVGPIPVGETAIERLMENLAAREITLLGRPRRGSLPAPPDVSEAPSMVQILRPAVDRTRLPRGVQLELDGGVEVLRSGAQGVVQVNGVVAWPSTSKVYLLGRTPRGRMRTLDQVRSRDLSMAEVSIEMHESDFLDDDQLRFDLVDRAGATDADWIRTESTFALLRSELVRLQLLSAEVDAQFGRPRAVELDREQRLVMATLRGSIAPEDDGDLEQCIGAAAHAGSLDGVVTTRVRRDFFAPLRQ